MKISETITLRLFILPILIVFGLFLYSCCGDPPEDIYRKYNILGIDYFNVYDKKADEVDSSNYQNIVFSFGLKMEFVFDYKSKHNIQMASVGPCGREGDVISYASVPIDSFYVLCTTVYNNEVGQDVTSLIGPEMWGPNPNQLLHYLNSEIKGYYEYSLSEPPAKAGYYSFSLNFRDSLNRVYTATSKPIMISP